MLDATRLRVLVAIARHGSVTAAARALNYAQPSISHHMARLEAETGAKLMERRGRGVRLTEAGRLLAERAEEILGRIDAAEAELAAHIGLRRDRVRLAGFGAALGTLAAAATTTLRAELAATEVLLIQAEPAEALRMLRAGEVDVALTYRYLDAGSAPDPGAPGPGLSDPAPSDHAPSDHAPSDHAPPDHAPPDHADLRYQLLLDEPVYLIIAAGQESATPEAGAASLGAFAAGRWIAGDERSDEVLASLCRRAGFSPGIVASACDGTAAQALVAAGFGAAILPGLVLRSARHPDVTACELAGVRHQVFVVTYGAPPDPPASARLIDALLRAASASP